MILSCRHFSVASSSFSFHSASTSGEYGSSGVVILLCLSLLVLGRPQAGPASAGCALHTVFVAGRRLVSCGELLTVDLRWLRAKLWDALPRRRPGSEVREGVTPGPEYHACAECEYRAAMNLDGDATSAPPSAGGRLATPLAWNPLQAP